VVSTCMAERFYVRSTDTVSVACTVPSRLIGLCTTSKVDIRDVDTEERKNVVGCPEESYNVR
jgi:hypothetical protein